MGSRHSKKDSGFLIQAAILATASVVVRIIGLIYRIPLTNIIGDAGNGFYSCAFEVYAIALLISSYSLPLAVSKLVSARMIKGERRNAYKVFKSALFFALIIGGLISLVIFFGADYIASHIMTLELSVYALRVLAPGLIIVAVMGVIRGYFQGLGTMIPTAASQIVEQIINAVVSVAGASYLFSAGERLAKEKGNDLLGPAYGAAGGTLGTVVGALFACIFLLFILVAFKGTIKRQLRNDRSRHVESYHQIFIILFMTILPVIMSTAIYNVSQVLDQGIFNKIMSVQGHAESEYSALWGMFSGKYNLLINVPLAMANALGVSVIPSLTAAVTAGERRQVHSKINLAIRFAMIIAIPSFIGYVVLASPLMQLLFGDARTTPAAMLSLGAITVVFYCLSTITNAILQGINQMTTPVKNAAVSLVIHLVCLFIMLVMFKWGIYSIVIGNVIFSFSMCLLNSRAIERAVGYRQETKKTFIIPSIAAVVMGIITFTIHLLLDVFMGGKIATLLSILVAIIAYSIAIILLGGLTEREILAMPKGRMIVRILKKVHLLKQERYDETY